MIEASGIKPTTPAHLAAVLLGIEVKCSTCKHSRNVPPAVPSDPTFVCNHGKSIMSRATFLQNHLLGAPLGAYRWSCGVERQDPQGCGPNANYWEPG